MLLRYKVKMDPRFRGDDEQYADDARYGDDER